MLLTKLYIYAIALVILAGFVTLAFSFQHPGSTLYNVSAVILTLGDIAIGFFLYSYGHTKNTKYKLWLQFSIFLMLGGFLFKNKDQSFYLHGAEHIYNISLMLLATIYLMSYLSRKEKKLTDHLKLLYVLSFTLLAFLRDNKIYDNIYLNFLSQLVLWIVFFVIASRVLEAERQKLLLKE